MSRKQDWKSPKANIQESSIGGRGLFANADIKQGEKVIIWGGNYTDKAGSLEAEKKGFLVIQWDDDLFSVENRGEDEGYFINHSCDSNMWMEDAYTLVTNRDVSKGAEFTIDYGLFEADESYKSKWECKCGSSLCRKVVTGFDWQREDLQNRYKEHFSPLINKRIEHLKKTEIEV